MPITDAGLCKPLKLRWSLIANFEAIIPRSRLPQNCLHEPAAEPGFFLNLTFRMQP